MLLSAIEVWDIAVVGLEQKQGQQSIAERANPHYWYILYAEPGSCDLDMPSKENYFSYELHFYNPDYHGNPTDHFGSEQRGEVTSDYEIRDTVFVV